MDKPLDFQITGRDDFSAAFGTLQRAAEAAAHATERVADTIRDLTNPEPKDV